uniref:Uncharacterized protein n=1 Tax=viral metagenome TaxID=1070528 RepID=A0A6H1ZZ73_9ZZZZ
MGLYCKCGNPVEVMPGLKIFHQGNEVCQVCLEFGLQPRREKAAEGFDEYVKYLKQLKGENHARNTERPHNAVY